MPLARADLESLLRARQLDRTLTTSLPPLASGDDLTLAPSGITTLDARLGGGVPRGQLSEIVGPRSSGRTSVLLQLLAAATARGELVAVVDALDMLDVESAAAAGVDLDRLLWVRRRSQRAQRKCCIRLRGLREFCGCFPSVPSQSPASSLCIAAVPSTSPRARRRRQRPARARDDGSPRLRGRAGDAVRGTVANVGGVVNW
ncbi:MAG: hypothetical protein HY048_00195 [Acidobacteria bacterium]|nr:hypothetical protein [Acidobacteriota bacterium]